MQKKDEVDDSEKDSLHNASTHASDVLDMPVDPNEPTYCLCHQVSYGEMIGCDNLDVSSDMEGMANTIYGNLQFDFSAPSNGFILPVSVSPISPKANGFVQNVHRIERRNKCIWRTARVRVQF